MTKIQVDAKKTLTKYATHKLLLLVFDGKYYGASQ